MEKRKLTPLNKFIIYLIEAFPPFKNFFVILVAIITPLLLVIAVTLGWMSFKKVKDVATNDFNQQQLILARHTAKQIENILNIFKEELSLLSLSPSIQYLENVSIGKRMEITFSSIKEEGVLEINYISSLKLLTHLIDSHGYRIISTNPEDISYLKWAGRKENKGNILITDISLKTYRHSHQRLLMNMVIPVWQVSVDESYPVATNKFSGVLLFVVDANILIEKTTKDIRSGKTGYAWVIDSNGKILYHPEREFVGRNAFEVRKEKKPTISFVRINEIQKKMMLTGGEGTSWYISGWHRGVESEMKKLIAYAPIHLDNKTGNRIWSVAVVAPISEVEDAIHGIQLRLFFLEGFITIAILTGGLLIIGMVLKWSNLLKEDVKKKTQELEKSEERYRSLIENANDIIFTVDRNYNITSINYAGCLFFKKPREEIMDSNIGEICFNEESASLQFRAIDEVFTTQSSKQIIYPVTINGNEHWLSTNFSGLLDEGGSAYAVLGIARDITQMKRIDEQMYHTEKLASMGTLSAGVAHEINNPLGIILGFTDLLLEKFKSDTQEYDALKTIEKHGVRAKRVVENLLSFARYTERKEEIVGINKCITTVLSVVENSFVLNKISTNRQFQDDLPPLKGCSEELQQVFFNIINNAISAMKGGGALTITTTALDNNEQIEIRFADTGHGIRKEYRSKIFDPLFTTKKVDEGTGLGLSVSYGIITKYGGTITFETKTDEESSKHGTTFIITLPVVRQ